VAEPRYDVVWPLAPVARRSAQLAAPVRPERPDLNGARIGFIWDYVFSGDVIFAEIKARLERRFARLSFVDYPTFGNIHGHDEDQVLERLPEVLQATEVDSVILGVGA
jgi:hypothetical protein